MADSATDTRHTQWLAHVAELLGAEASGLLSLAPGQAPRLLTQGHSPRAIVEYRDHYARLDPLASLLDERPEGRALVIDTRLHPAYVGQPELSHDYLRPHGIAHVIATQWQAPDGTRHLVGVQRFAGAMPFTIEQGRQFDHLVHHWRIAQALPPPAAFGQVREDQRRSGDIAAQLGIPLLVADGRLGVVWANAAAREEPGSVWQALLEGHSRDSYQHAARGVLMKLIHTAFAQHGSAEKSLLEAPDGSWFASATPLAGRPGLALLRLTAMHQLGRGLRARLQRLFKLTAAEAALTAQLAGGASLEEIAVARGVCLDTVRTQLRAVFRKTGTHRQGELVCTVTRLADG